MSLNKDNRFSVSPLKFKKEDVLKTSSCIFCDFSALRSLRVLMSFSKQTNLSSSETRAADLFFFSFLYASCSSLLSRLNSESLSSCSLLSLMIIAFLAALRRALFAFISFLYDSRKALSSFCAFL